MSLFGSEGHAGKGLCRKHGYAAQTVLITIYPRQSHPTRTQKIDMRPKVEYYTETYKWLAGLGVPGFEKRDWYLAPWGTKILHAEENCQTLLSSDLRIVRRSRLDFEKSVYTMCNGCGQGFLDTAGNTAPGNGVIQAVFLHAVYQHTFNIVGSTLSVISKTPALYAVLTKHVAAALQTQMSQIGEIYPILEIAKTVVETNIKHMLVVTRQVAGFDDSGDKAVGEAALFVLKDEARNTLQTMICKRVKSDSARDAGTQLLVMHLLTKWLRAIETPENTGRVSEVCKTSTEAEILRKRLPDLDALIDAWEQTFINIWERHRQQDKLFYVADMPDTNKIPNSLPSSIKEAISMSGLKVYNKTSGLGELPALVVTWLLGQLVMPTMKAHAVQKEHQHLTDEQWCIALSLLTDGDLYHDSGEAIRAALELDK